MKRKLSEIATITMGQSPSSEYYNTDAIGLPFLQGNRTFGDQYPTFDTWTSRTTKVAYPNEVLMSVRAPVGALNFAPSKLCIGRGLCSISMKNGNNRYLYYLLQYNIPKICALGNGTTFSCVNGNDLSNLEIEVHSEEHQLRITNIA